jgi:hypothetical protein
MDQQNMAIAAAGIIVSLGILAVGFNKLTPDNFPPEYSFGSQSTVGTYPEKRYEEPREEPREDFEEPRYEDRRRSDNSTSVIVGGTRCVSCQSKLRYTRKK